MRWAGLGKVFARKRLFGYFNLSFADDQYILMTVGPLI
jgi:hypothetical protein